MNRYEAGREIAGDGPPAKDGGPDWLRFLGTWARHPLKMGAVAASSPAYCAEMVDCASVGTEGPVLELGAGLGVVTQALLDAGVAPDRITSIEYDPGFAATLKRRFPQVNVLCGDGFDLDRTLGERADERFAAILFAIPALHLSTAERQTLFTDYLNRLRPGGNLTQLSYLWKAPVPPLEGVFTVSHSRIVWNNIPPARVWIYRHVGGGGAAHAQGLVEAAGPPGPRD